MQSQMRVKPNKSYMANIKEQYRELIKSFLTENNIKEVVCTDTKEHFFDKIVVTNKQQREIEVFAHGFTTTTWKNLYFDFSVDYAQCLANMEHDLYLQTRNGKHNKYNFIFDEDYIKPTLVSLEDIKGLDKYDNL